MAIITISRGSYTRGKEIAEKVAEKLGYECIAREAVLEASKEFNIPEIKLVRALHDAPSILDRFSYGKEKFIAFYRLAFLKNLQKDNIVYHGLAGHFLLKGVSHVLKVRIIADMEERVKLEMEREKISETEARRLLKNDDEERRKWSQYVHGVDTNDPSLYDLILKIRKLSVDDAVDIISHTVGLEDFRTTKESTEAFANLLLAAQVKVAIIDHAPDAEVFAKNGLVRIKAKSPVYRTEEFVDALKKAAKEIPGVKEIENYNIPVLPLT
jgi:cytidylate kinase